MMTFNGSPFVGVVNLSRQVNIWICVGIEGLTYIQKATAVQARVNPSLYPFRAGVRPRGQHRLCATVDASKCKNMGGNEEKNECYRG